MYLNIGSVRDLIIDFGLEPTHEMYLNSSGGNLIGDSATSWTDTWDVFKWGFTRIKKRSFPLEPTHEMYLNRLRNKLMDVEMDLNRHMRCI